MRISVLKRLKRCAAGSIASLVVVAMPASAVHAESFFQKLFGWGNAPAAKATVSPPKPVPSLGSFSRSSLHGRYSSASSDFGDSGEDSTGSYRTLCVRTCDGYYFPISSRASSRRFSRDARRCKAECGAEGQLFYLPKGSDDVKNMTSLDGHVYGRLPMAFAYRKSLINGCACKPMPWSEAEAARHDQYALIAELDKAQERNAEIARSMAAAAPDAENVPSSATVAAKLAEAIVSKTPELAAEPAAEIMLLAMAEPTLEPARKADPVLPSFAPVPPILPAPVNSLAALSGSNGLGHLLPATLQQAVAQDVPVAPSLPAKRARKANYSRAARTASSGTTQSVSWFNTQAKYSWPGDAPVRRR